MKRFKLIVWILSLIWMLSFSYWAELRIAPGMWSVWKDCVQGFDIYLDMEEGEEALALDIILDSNMEFVNFENAWLFSSYIPPRNLWKEIHFVLMNAWFGNIAWWGLLWKVYYKTVLDENPYIHFVFDWKWERADTNVAINGEDLLDNVINWDYRLDYSVSCAEFTWDIYGEQDFHDALDGVVDHLSAQLWVDDENNWINDKKSWVLWNIYYVFWWFIILVVLLCVFLKKWRK